MTTETTTRTAWLLEQIAADEALAKAATRGPWETWEDINAEVFVSEVGRRGFGVVTQPAIGREDYGKANATHIATHDPARVLVTCAAHRAIVEIHPGSSNEDECPGCGAWLDGQWETGPGDTCPILSALASIYADRPGFDSRWVDE